MRLDEKKEIIIRQELFENEYNLSIIDNFKYFTVYWTVQILFKHWNIPTFTEF